MKRMLSLLVLSFAGCRIEASYKVAEFESVEYKRVFSICRELLSRHYTGVVIRADEPKGQIETDDALFNTSKGLRRERACINVIARQEGVVEVAVFAPMYKQEIDPDTQPPVRWVALGSDVKQERRLLDEIMGEVLAAFPDAAVRSQPRW